VAASDNSSPPPRRKNAAAIPRGCLVVTGVLSGAVGVRSSPTGLRMPLVDPRPEVNHGRPRRATSAPGVPHVDLTGITGLGGLPGRPRPRGPWRRDLCRPATRATERG